jgi:phage internal scaffolding protein
MSNYNEKAIDGIKVFGSSKTKQSFKDECDINLMVERYEKTGLLPQMINDNPAYGDFSNPLDYQSSLDLIMKADEQFMALPANIRDRFKDDAREFLAFVNDSKNSDELVSMGLATKKEVLNAANNNQFNQANNLANNNSNPQGVVGTGGSSATPGGSK